MKAAHLFIGIFCTICCVFANTLELSVSSEHGSRVMRTDLPKNRAYVTLLYNNFIIGVRTLGKSLQLTETTADLIVLVTPDVSSQTRALLIQDGWLVHPVDVEKNPNQKYLARLQYVYTKLIIYEMIEYDRIVFLDADTVVLDNVDELFYCEPFCAVMRHSELINTGVLVISPSKDLYNDMKKQFGDLYSYTGGDQGFLNSYFHDISACPFFDPFHHSVPNARLHYKTNFSMMITGDPFLHTQVTNPEMAHTQHQSPNELDLRCRRLPNRYNGDWPLLFVDKLFNSLQFYRPDIPEGNYILMFFLKIFIVSF